MSVHNKVPALLAGAIMVALGVGMLADCGAARAQTPSPDEVIATTQAIGGSYSGCLLSIENRETGGTFRADAYNPTSGATGPLQYLPSGGVWSVTPLAQQGVSVAVASLAEQIAMGAWALAAGYGSAWAPLPC